MAKQEPIDLTQATGCLDVMGCSQDPIYYRGEETTPGELDYVVDNIVLASRVRIMFWGLGYRLLRGSLRDMLYERLGVPHKAKALTKKERKALKAMVGNV